MMRGSSTGNNSKKINNNNHRNDIDEEEEEETSKLNSSVNSLASNFEWDEGISTSDQVNIGMDVNSFKTNQPTPMVLHNIDVNDSSSDEDQEGLDALAESLGLSDEIEKQRNEYENDRKKNKAAATNKITPRKKLSIKTDKESTLRNSNFVKKINSPITSPKSSFGFKLKTGDGKNNKIAHSPNLSPSAAILTNKNSSSDLSWFLDNEEDEKNTNKKGRKDNSSSNNDTKNNSISSKSKTAKNSLRRVLAGLTSISKDPLSSNNNNTTLVSPIVKQDSHGGKSSRTSSTSSNVQSTSRRIVLDDDLSRNFDVKPSPRTAMGMRAIWDDDVIDLKKTKGGIKKKTKGSSPKTTNKKKTTPIKKKKSSKKKKANTSPVMEFKAGED